MAAYTFQTIIYPGAISTNAFGLNDTGQVVGYFEDGVGHYHGFIETSGAYLALDVPGDGNYDTKAYSINNAGQIVGQFNDKTGVTHGFIYNGTYATFDVPNASSTYISGNNDHGDLVGEYINSSGQHSFEYSGGTFTNLFDPAGYRTDVREINNNGRTVGTYNGSRGFYEQNGIYTTVQPIDTGYTFGEGINDAGVVVGTYNPPQLPEVRGFVYADGAYTDLTYTGSKQIEPEDINNIGQIVGKVKASSDISFLATPSVCFASGTSIRTAKGDISVEMLRVGDLAVTASGEVRPIVWLGHRRIVFTDPASRSDGPVRILAGAFGDGLPTRDLTLSPGHPVLVSAHADGRDGYLVPIMCLINGTTIDRVPVDEITYWHVELDSHDILLAEGLPAESYIDLGSRPWFAGADGALYDPDLALPGMPGRCRPVAVEGPVVEAERRRLDAVFAGRLSKAAAWPDIQNALLALV